MPPHPSLHSQSSPALRWWRFTPSESESHTGPRRRERSLQVSGSEMLVSSNRTRTRSEAIEATESGRALALAIKLVAFAKLQGQNEIVNQLGPHIQPDT